MTKQERIKAFIEASRDAYPTDFTGKFMAEQLDDLGYFDAPASTKYHGAYPGGLFDHSLNVYNALKELTKTQNLTWKNDDSIFLISFLHDLCKADAYIANADGTYSYNKDTLFQGHAEKSLLMIQCYLMAAISEEEVLCIKHHMGAFTDKEHWSEFTGAIHHNPNVLWVHVADMMAAHIMEVEKK